MNLEKYLKNPVFKILSKIADENKLELYVVGGYVRDLLLKQNQDKSDIDFVGVGSGIELAQKLAERLGNKTEVKYFKRFGTISLDKKKACIEDWKMTFNSGLEMVCIKIPNEK